MKKKSKQFSENESLRYITRRITQLSITYSWISSHRLETLAKTQFQIKNCKLGKM